MQFKLLGVGFLALALAGGCGGDDDDGESGGGGGSGGSGGSAGSSGSAGSAGSTGGSAGGTSVPLSDAIEAVIDVQCNAILTCAGDLAELWLAGMDCDTYFGNSFRDGQWPLIEEAVADGSIIYDGTKIQACLDAWEALGCDIFVMREPPVCEEALQGTVDVGGDCTLNAECKGPTFCKSNDGCPGTCTARLSEGSACSESDQCEAGLTCDDLLGECVVPSPAGEPCKAGQPDCEFGLLCTGNEDTTPGTCMEMADVLVNGNGESCGFDSASWCEKGLSCVLVNWTASGPEATCQAVVASGATCGIGIPNQCPADEYCNADPQGTGSWTGTCVPLPTDGEPCADYEAGATCAPYHVCDTGGTCRQLQRLEGTCAEDATCYSDNCEAGECAPLNACE